TFKISLSRKSLSTTGEDLILRVSDFPQIMQQVPSD
ncbi:unnamed protein product, partial [Brassica rapa]